MNNLGFTDSKRTKIMLVALSCRGGMLHYTSQLANALSQQGDVTAIIPHHVVSDLFCNEVHIQKVRTGTSFTNYLLACLNIGNFIALRKCIESSSPDVIHIVTSHPWNPIVLFLARAYPTVCTIHDPKKHAGEFILLLYLSDRLVMRRCNAVFVHGVFWKDYLVRQGLSASTVTAIPHGDYSFFKQWSNQSGEDSKWRTALFFGRIARYKGLDILCQAEPMVSNEIADFRIVIAGQGDTSYFSSLIIHPDRFLILNKYIDEIEVPGLFEEAKLVVLPYIDASQTGIVPIAYAFHKPVVVTNVGALPESVEDGVTGFIVPPQDPYRFAQAIINVLRNEPRRKQMGDAAHEKMRRDMSWAAVARLTLDVYEKVINEKRKL